MVDGCLLGTSSAGHVLEEFVCLFVCRHYGPSIAMVICRQSHGSWVGYCLHMHIVFACVMETIVLMFCYMWNLTTNTIFTMLV